MRTLERKKEMQQLTTPEELDCYLDMINNEVEELHALIGPGSESDTTE